MTRNVLVAAVVAVIMAGSVLVYTYVARPRGAAMVGAPEGQRMARQTQATTPVVDQLQQVQWELIALRKELAVLQGTRRGPMPMLGPCGQVMGMMRQMGSM